MFIAPGAPKEIFAPAERDVYGPTARCAPNGAEEVLLVPRSYKHWAALRPGRLPEFVMRTLETGH